MFPRLISCFVAIDEATAENGALTVLKGSHTCGRIDHEEVSGLSAQPGGESSRVELLEAQFEKVVCAMSPGDILWFHCNTLCVYPPPPHFHPCRLFMLQHCVQRAHLDSGDRRVSHWPAASADTVRTPT